MACKKGYAVYFFIVCCEEARHTGATLKPKFLNLTIVWYTYVQKCCFPNGFLPC